MLPPVRTLVVIVRYNKAQKVFRVAKNLSTVAAEFLKFVHNFVLTASSSAHNPASYLPDAFVQV